MLYSILLSTLISSPQTISGVALIEGKPAVNAVIWAEGIGTPKPVRTSIVQVNKSFRPRIAVVPVGSTIDFPNKDAIFHNVFAEYNAKKFDLGMYPKGKSKNVTFDRPGLVTVLCNMHSEMSAFVMVVKSAHYTVTDRLGRFSLPGVPEGDFELRAWHESGKKAATSVGPGKISAPLTLSLRR